MTTFTLWGVVWDSCSNENKRTIEKKSNSKLLELQQVAQQLVCRLQRLYDDRKALAQALTLPPIQNNKQISTKLPYTTPTTKGAVVLEISSAQLRRFCHSSDGYCYIL